MSSNGGIGQDGHVYCKHMEEAAKRISNNPLHPDREYYICNRPRGDGSKCDFWSWANELRPIEGTVHPSSSPTRSPSKGGAGPSARPTPTRPSQKVNASPVVTPQSKKRMEDIEAGLRQRKHDLSPIRLPAPKAEEREEPIPGSIDIAQATLPQPPSPVPTEVDTGEVEEQPRKTYSFLGLHHSPESVVAAIKDEDQPSTPDPKKRRTTRPATDAVPSGSGLLLTPPETTRRVTELDQPGFHSNMRNNKGKGREDAPLAQTQSLDDFINSNSQAEDSLPLFAPAEDVPISASVSPTIADNVLDYTGGVKERVKALSEYMDSFDVTHAAKLLQKMERQRIQYEHRDRSQKRRIEQLEAERDELVMKVARMSEELRRAEERNASG